MLHTEYIHRIQLNEEIEQYALLPTRVYKRKKPQGITTTESSVRNTKQFRLRHISKTFTQSKFFLWEEVSLVKKIYAD